MREKFVLLILTLLAPGCSGHGLYNCAPGTPGCDCRPDRACGPEGGCATGTCEPPDANTASGGAAGTQTGTSASTTNGGGSSSVGQNGDSGFSQSGGQAGNTGTTGGTSATTSRQTTGARVDAGIDGAGDSGPGGTTGTADKTVNFREGKAIGAMAGQGWVRSDPGVRILTPGCKTIALTSNALCDYYKWSTYDTLYVQGVLQPFGATGQTLTGGGVMVAAYVTDPPGQGLGRSYRSLTANIDATPSRGLEILAHRKGDADGLVYRAYIWKYQSVQFTDLVRDSSAIDQVSKFSPADVPNLDWIGFYLPPADSEETGSLNLRSIVFE